MSNYEEIVAGFQPGDKTNTPSSNQSNNTPRETCEERNAQSNWNVCGYDLAFTYKRMYRDFCGQAPSFSQVTSFDKLSKNEKEARLHNELDTCMESEYWRGKDGFVWQLGHPKIRPLQTLKSGENYGQIPLGDYDDDFHLFMYYQLNGRDVRGLLTAQHFAMRQEQHGKTEYVPVEHVPVHPEAKGVVLAISNVFQGRQQFVPVDKRAGMLSTMWNATFNTMFTSIPRTTAAHALRSYLDIDIAKSEGLIKPNDPNYTLVDHDSKGIKDPACSFCHEVLDPASYAFTKYNGLSFKIPFDVEVDVEGVFDPENDDVALQIPDFIPDDLVERFVQNSKLLLPGMYKDRRVELVATLNETTEPNLANTPEKGFLFGKPVANLLEWADVAANSDDFLKSVVKDYWKPLVRKPIKEVQNNPQSVQYSKDFDLLWQYLKQNNYSVQAMLHELVRSKSYGAP